MADPKTPEAPAAAPATAPMTIDAEAGYKMQIEQLSRENKGLQEELAAYRQLETERDAAAKAAKGKKDAARTVEARALMNLRGARPYAGPHTDNDGERPGDAIPEAELVGLTEGVHFKYAPVG